MRSYHLLSIVLVIGLSLPACLPRDRLNVNCQWNERDAQQLDLRNNSHRQHLNQDVEIAIEVVFRSADAEHGRRYRYSAHGGYVDGGRFRDACRETVFAAIADAHGLAIDQVRNARATRTRDWRTVVMAAVPFAVLYYLAAVILCRMWMARFSADERRQRLLAFVITSVAASIGGVQLAVLWFNIAEMIRVGNDHLGQARAYPTSSRYLAAIFLPALFIFWFAALRQYRRRSPTPLLAANEHLLRLNS